MVIVGISKHVGSVRKLYGLGEDGKAVIRQVETINAYLVSGANVIVQQAPEPLASMAKMDFGNKPVDGGNLLLSTTEAQALNLSPAQHQRFVRRIYGAAEFIRGLSRYVLWIKDEHLNEVMQIVSIHKRIEKVRKTRLASRDKGAREMASRAHQMREMNIGCHHAIAIPCISSEAREYLPVGLLDHRSTVSNLAFVLYDAPLWTMALIASRLHLVWIATVCGKLKTDFRYSNTMGWNTFPVPLLTEKNPGRPHPLC